MLIRLWRWFRSERAFPVRAYLVALALRLIPVLLAINMGIGLDDMFQYDMLARSLAAGNGYRWYAQEDLPLIQGYINLDLSTVDYDARGVLTSFRPPLYPAFLALIYLLTGVDANRYFTARLVQAFLQAALVPLTYALARRFVPERERAARSAAWVVAFYPMLVLYPLALATENLFFVLVLASTLALLKAKESLAAGQMGGKNRAPVVNGFFHHSRWFIFAGILLGLTALTRSISLAFAGLAVLWVWFILRERKMAAVMFLFVVVITLPWMVRNTLLHHRITGIETTLGYNLYLGYHPEGSGTFQYPQSLDLLTILDDSVRDESGRAQAWEFIKADPWRVPYLFICRVGHFFGLEERALMYFYSNNFFGYIPPAALLAMFMIICLPFVAVSISGTFGLALTRWRAETLLLAALFIGYITPHLLIMAEDRFHLTLVPFLAILAAHFWAGGWRAIQERWQTRSGKIALVLAGVAVLLLFTNWSLELWREADKLAILFGPHGNHTGFSY